jgi:hypothetical protein
MKNISHIKRPEVLCDLHACLNRARSRKHEPVFYITTEF